MEGSDVADVDNAVHNPLDREHHKHVNSNDEPEGSRLAALANTEDTNITGGKDLDPITHESIDGLTYPAPDKDGKT